MKKLNINFITLLKNIQIYFKWGFIKYIKTDYEYYSSSEKVIVNYYEKTLK